MTVTETLLTIFQEFFRQCKDPSRFGFYRIAADQAEKLLEVMKELLKIQPPMRNCSPLTRWTLPVMRKQ